jgi:DNA-binding response OmpR family regulator
MASILFVDDDPQISQIYSMVLTKKGHEVMVAASVMQAEMSLKSASYDYVFLDMKMPDFGGLDVLKQADLRHKYPQTKVVALTNSESDELKRKAQSLGVTDYLIKVDFSPYGLAQMLETGAL